MLIKIFNLLLLALLLMLFFVIMQEPYELNNYSKNIDFKSFEAKDVKAYEVFDKKLNKTANAKEYFKLHNSDNFRDFTLIENDKMLSSKYVQKSNSVIELKNDVVYKDKDIEIKSNLALYNTDTKLLYSNEKINADYKNNSLEANSFIYNTTTKELILNEVYLCIEK